MSFSQVMLQPALPLLQGFLLCIGLIMSIGPQNLFILKQGLRRRHLFVTALLCTLFDLILISLGVGGIGATLAAEPRILAVTTWGGAIFLFGYGVRTLRSAWYAPALAERANGEIGALSVTGTVVAILTVSFVNPAAYLDTLLMIGTTSSRYPLDERLFFGAGAVMASALWFFTLTYGASRLTPLFRHPAAWRTLDLVSGCLLVGLAVSLSVTQSFGLL